jgi:hypothetical protein
VTQVKDNDEIVRQAISHGLLALGEPIMRTILWHLKAQGIFLDSRDEINVRLLYQELEQIVGNIADEVMNEIYENLMRTKQNEPLEFNNNGPIVNRIEQFLEMSARGGK